MAPLLLGSRPSTSELSGVDGCQLSFSKLSLLPWLNYHYTSIIWDKLSYCKPRTPEWCFITRPETDFKLLTKLDKLLNFILFICHWMLWCVSHQHMAIKQCIVWLWIKMIQLLQARNSFTNLNPSRTADTHECQRVLHHMKTDARPCN